MQKLIRVLNRPAVLVILTLGVVVAITVSGMPKMVQAVLSFLVGATAAHLIYRDAPGRGNNDH